MTDDFQQDALKEREEWLAAMGATEEMIHKDRNNELEFIYLPLEDGEALTRVHLPFSIQSATIFNSQTIKVKN